MTKTQQIQNLMKRKPNMSVAEIAEKLGVSRVTVYAARKHMAQVVAEEKEFESEPVLPAVDTRQVGGDHYTRLEIQPWEVIERNNMGFFDGNAVKYLMRYKAKGGVQDLEKARHYLDKLIELENGSHAGK
jgi:hypothetical protein